MYAFIVADDIGEKLWPVTNLQFPKALFPVYSENTLLEETILRLISFVEKGENIFICIPEKALDTVTKQGTLEAFSIPVGNVCVVPESKGSLWSILKMCQKISRRKKKEPVIVSPVDQFFWPQEALLYHLNNMVSGSIANPEEVIALCLPPGGPSPWLNYLHGDWEGVEMPSAPTDSVAGLLSTLFIDIQDCRIKPDYEAAQSLATSDWLWDLTTYMASVSLIEQSIKRLGDYSEFTVAKDVSLVWEQLPAVNFEDTVIPYLIESGQIKAAVIPRISWSTLDNWVSIQHLLYDAGLFNLSPVEEIHQIESHNNLVIKPVGKDVALYGVSDLIIIDTGNKLLIGTPEGLYENF